jgi:hypothetical protein
MRSFLGVLAVILVCFLASIPGAPAQPAPPPQLAPQESFSPNELVDAGQKFFGTISQGLATVIEKAVSQWGLPNGYVLGEEAGGAFLE